MCLFIPKLPFAEKYFQSNDFLSKIIFGQMTFRPNELFRANDHSVKWPFKFFRSNDLSVEQPFGQEPFIEKSLAFQFSQTNLKPQHWKKYFSEVKVCLLSIFEEKFKIGRHLEFFLDHFLKIWWAKSHITKMALPHKAFLLSTYEIWKVLVSLANFHVLGLVIPKKRV
jgi:hypothetical protein